jgi:tetratricopeptide (TPR) repeat protein
LTLKPNDPAILSDRALLLRDLKRDEEALSDYNKVLGMNPNSFQAKQGKAWTLILLHRDQEALDFIEKLLKNEPECIEFLNIKATALSHLQRDKDAIAVYDQAIALKPNQALTWYNKACHFARRDNIDQAIFCLQEALKINPEWVKINLTTDTDFDRIRDDIKFQNL